MHKQALRKNDLEAQQPRLTSEDFVWTAVWISSIATWVLSPEPGAVYQTSLDKGNKLVGHPCFKQMMCSFGAGFFCQGWNQLLKTGFHGCQSYIDIISDNEQESQ